MSLVVDWFCNGLYRFWFFVQICFVLWYVDRGPQSGWFWPHPVFTLSLWIMRQGKDIFCLTKTCQYSPLPPAWVGGHPWGSCPGFSGACSFRSFSMSLQFFVRFQVLVMQASTLFSFTGLVVLITIVSWHFHSSMPIFGVGALFWFFNVFIKFCVRLKKT